MLGDPRMSFSQPICFAAFHRLFYILCLPKSRTNKHGSHKTGKRAAELYRRLGYDETGAGAPKQSSDFNDHYNTTLHRCLIAIEVTSFQGSQEVINKFLLDVDEKRAFGELMWMSSDTKKYWEQKPVTCEMKPPDKDNSFCKSTDEYDAYVDELMR